MIKSGFEGNEQSLGWFLKFRRDKSLRTECTWTPRMPKIMKKAQQIRTMFPMGLRDVMRVSTTSFNPGALLITLQYTDKKTIKTKTLALSSFKS